MGPWYASDLLLRCFMKCFSEGNLKKKASCGSSENGGELGSCPDPSLGASGPDLWLRLWSEME